MSIFWGKRKRSIIEKCIVVVFLLWFSVSVGYADVLLIMLDEMLQSGPTVSYAPTSGVPIYDYGEYFRIDGVPFKIWKAHAADKVDVITTSEDGSDWAVPADWSDTNTIIAIGAGGSGGGGNGDPGTENAGGGGGGGEGGNFVSVSSWMGLSGSIPVNVGAGSTGGGSDTNGTAGEPTSFNNESCSDDTNTLCARGGDFGDAGGATSGGQGGSDATANIIPSGVTTNADRDGGDGGTGGNESGNDKAGGGGGGGGGAGGANNDGSAGGLGAIGPGGPGAQNGAGGGGGEGDGGATGAGSDGATADATGCTNAGGAGGSGGSTDGGDGGDGCQTDEAGLNGSAGVGWTDTEGGDGTVGAGAGGGGGGGGSNNSAGQNGGDGGLYGGGGAGGGGSGDGNSTGGTGGAGRDGLIIILWTTANALPSAASVSIDSGAASVTLTEDTTTTVSCTGTVTDADGFADIQSVLAYFYRTNAGTTTADADSYKYQLSGDSQCVPSNGSGNSEDYTCDFSVQFFAHPTDTGSPYAADDWTCEMWPTDTVASGTPATDTIEMDSLTALNVTGSIDYNTVNPGTNTGTTNQTTTVTNTGNRSLDVDLSGDVMCAGSFPSCPGDSIVPGQQKYDTAAFDYDAAGNALPATTSPTTVVLDLPLPEATTTPVTDDILWGVGIPLGKNADTYQGQNTFTATADD